MQAVILAGGIGTRLRPMTNDIPKPMVSINGRPFLEYQLALLKRQGFDRIILSVGYLAGKIQDYFGAGAKFGVNIAYSVEEKPLGTGGALRNACDILEDEFLLLNGDTYLDMPYKDVVDFFHREKGLGAVVAYDNALKIADNNIEMAGENNVSGYGPGPASSYVDAGVYVFKKDIVREMKPGAQISLKDGVLEPLIQLKSLLGYKTALRYYDIGTFDRIQVFAKEVKI